MAGLFAVMIALMSVSSSVAAYDDPAVVVCEQLAKAEFPKDAKFERRSAVISGASVTIEYEVTILTTKPKTGTQVCRFTLDRQTKRYSVTLLPLRSSKFEAACDVLLKQPLWPDRNEGLDQAEERLKMRSQKAGKCASYFRELSRTLKAINAILYPTGLYPIPAADTKLEQR